jgi:predicted HTH domain antitoxin
MAQDNGGDGEKRHGSIVGTFCTNPQQAKNRKRRWGESMRTLQIEYPEGLPAVANQSRESFERDARLAMAVKLYELGRLSSGQAAIIAGIPRAEFLLPCHECGATTVDWDSDDITREFSEGGGPWQDVSSATRTPSSHWPVEPNRASDPGPERSDRTFGGVCAQWLRRPETALKSFSI